MASRFILHDIENITDYIGFEILCNDVMSLNGYKNIEPLGGYHDRGRDAIHKSINSGITTIFCYSVRKDYKQKLLEDLRIIKHHGHDCNHVIYITTNKISPSKNDELKEITKNDFNWKLEIYDLIRLATLIENHYDKLIIRYSNIFILSSTLKEEDVTKKLNIKLYSKYLLGLYDIWIKQYTPLFGDYREIDTYVLKNTDDSEMDCIPITNIPSISPLSVILGEAGSGKTTSLWKILVDECTKLNNGESINIPIFINFRRWDNVNKCRKLAQDAFDFLDIEFKSIENELLSGGFIILIDGLNELPANYQIQTPAYQDLKQFIIKYCKNRFVLSCRTVDFENRILNLEEESGKLPEISIYEIRRINKEQILSYIKNYLDIEKSEDLISQLEINNETNWDNNSSILHLARIPLFLKLIIYNFKKEGELPKNLAQLLKSFIIAITQRETVRYSSSIDIIAKERLLGRLTYELTKINYSLSIPETIILNVLGRIFMELKDEGFISSELTISKIWYELLSNNFLKRSENNKIEWLHPLLFDYFLGSEIVNILSDPKQEKVSELYNLLDKSIKEQPVIIALGILDSYTASAFLKKILKINELFAQNVYLGQEEDKKLTLADILITKELSNSDVDFDLISEVATGLPFYEFVEKLYQSFKYNSEKCKVGISQIITTIIIKNYEETLVKYEFYTFFENRNDKNRKEHIRIGIKRSFQVLSTLINNKNELVQFYSAKELWEYDKGRSAEVLKKLNSSETYEVSKLVKDLMEEWGIE